MDLSSATDNATTKVVTQNTHENPGVGWPLPMGRGLLVEIDFKQQRSTIELLDHGLRNMSTGTIRATSPRLPNALAEEFLPGGTGSHGRRVLLPEPSLYYLEDSTYNVCGLEVPSPEENGYGDLAFIDFERIIGYFPDETDMDADLPFQPLGGRVFFEYDYDEDSNAVIEHGTGRKLQDPEEEASGLVTLESSVAAENQMATIIGVGPDVQEVSVGDRIIAKRFADSITYDGTEYNFVSSEDEIRALLPQ